MIMNYQTTAFFTVLALIAACGTSDSVDETSGTSSEAGNGPGGGPGGCEGVSVVTDGDTGGEGDDGDTSPPMHDMPLDGTDTGNDTGDGDGDGECDDETLSFMNGCILSEVDELEDPENTCADEATPGCGYQQCTGAYYQDYYQARMDVREYCAEIYPACAEFAQVLYYECLSGCYEELATCDDGTDCLSCAGVMGICTAACDMGPDTGTTDETGDDPGSESL